MSLDAVIDRMYASMSFEAGEAPDWDAQAEVFAPSARLVRVNDDGVFEFDPRSFRANFEEMITSGALPSFWESELWRDVDQYGDFAHVLSAYEMRASRDGPLVARAIKSIQLFRKDGRWWISAMLWRREGRDVRIEARFVNRPDFSESRRTMIEHALAFGARPPGEAREEWAAFDRFIAGLAERGWMRAAIHELTKDVLDHEHTRISERAFDGLCDFLGALEGNCLPEGVPRFPGEPEDLVELTRYARNKEWLKR